MDNWIGRVTFEMVRYFGKDVKRINHALKVLSFSNVIASSEGLDSGQLLVLEAAAILHDIGIKESERKYNSTAGKYQELEGPPIARQLLEEVGIPVEIVNRVCYLVGNHHSYHKIDGIDFQILVEADWLVNIFEDSMDKKQIQPVREKYFKTNAGIGLLETMYA